jgi:hypothetical protein
VGEREPTGPSRRPARSTASRPRVSRPDNGLVCSSVRGGGTAPLRSMSR